MVEDGNTRNCKNSGKTANEQSAMIEHDPKMQKKVIKPHIYFLIPYHWKKNMRTMSSIIAKSLINPKTF